VSDTAFSVVGLRAGLVNALITAAEFRRKNNGPALNV
jgi:hypothetical protein